MPTPRRPPPSDTVGTRLRRLVRVFLGTLVLVAACAAVSFVGTREGLDEVADEIEPLRRANGELLDVILDADTELRGFRLTWDRQYLGAYHEALDRYPGFRDRALELGGDDAEVGARVEREVELFERWRAYAAEIERLGLSDTEAAAALSRTGRGRALIDEIRRTSGQLEDELEDRVAAAEARSRSITRWAGLATLVVVVAGVATVGIVAARTNRLVSVPLERLRLTIARVRAGDRSARADADGPAVAEVRDLVGAFNDLLWDNEVLTELQRSRLDEERRIRALGREVRATLDPAEVAELTASGLGPATGADHVDIFLVEDDALDRRIGEWLAPGVPPRREQVQVRPHSDLVDHVFDDLAAGRSVVLADIDDHPDLAPEALDVFTRDGWCSVVLVPVSREGRVLALILLQTRDPEHRWPPDVIRLAEGVAAEMGIAFETARLFERERALVAGLREVDQAKSDFVSSVSHELRTPLTSIRGYVEMLREGDAGELTAPQDRMAAVVERNAERLLALIEDLLTLSRIESGSFRATAAAVDLREVVGSCVEAVGPAATGRGVELDVDLDPGVPILHADGHQLERVLLNLLSNAVKFSPEGGVVRIEAEPEDDAVVVRVSDEGIGIPEAEQDRLFTRFFRSSTAQELAIPGTGLGLVIAKTAVDNHGGSLDVRSRPGEGTTFTVRLPVDPTRSPEEPT